MSFDQASYSGGVEESTALGAPTAEVGSPALPEPESHVIREYDGIPATLAMWGPDGLICATDYFILTAVDQSDQEKLAMVFSFGDPILYGGTERQPRIYSYSGFLVDTQQSGSGAALWRSMYERYFRGSKCVEMKAIVELLFRDQWRRGYIVGTRPSLSADRPQMTTFSFVMFITDEGHS